MNILDKSIALISPKRAYERMAYREAMRSYDAADTKSPSQAWRATNAKAEVVDGMSRDIIRARSRDLERNADMSESILLAFERNVVGTGFELQATTENKELNDQIEDLFKEWSRAKYCDVTQQQSFSDICRMIVRRKKVDGGIIAVFRHLEQADNQVPISLQLFEVDDLDTVMVPTSKKRIVNGIEYNEFNRPIAYYLKQYDAYGNYAGVSERIEADKVCFLFRKRTPSQLREVSEFAVTVPRIRDMNQYIEAVSVKERVAALLAVMIKRLLPDGGFGGRSAGTKRFEYEGKRLSPGMIMELNPGDEVQVVTPPNQATNATEFLRTQQRLSGSGQGLSYEVTARDMSQVNYSSARQGLLEDQKTYAMEQEYIIEHFLRPLYEKFIETAVLAGLLKINNFTVGKSQYLKHKWIAQGSKWIDPLKEANANKIALANNLTTLQEIAGTMGKDWKELVDQRAEEIEYMRLKGVINNANENKGIEKSTEQPNKK